MCVCESTCGLPLPQPRPPALGSLTLSHSLSLFLPPLPAPRTPTVLLRPTLCPRALLLPADEVYAQKMKYKAISEELDNALNDITSL